jgi:hypothetical protein
MFEAWIPTDCLFDWLRTDSPWEVMTLAFTMRFKGYPWYITYRRKRPSDTP